MKTTIGVALACFLLTICQSKGEDGFIRIDLRVNRGEAFASSDSSEAKRAFMKDDYSQHQYWGGDSIGYGRNSKRRQAIWFRFEEPIEIAMISFDACHVRYGCKYDARRKRGPLEYKIIAAKECSSYYQPNQWREVHGEFYRQDRWWSDSPATHEINTQEPYRCYGIEIERVDSSRKGPAVANIQFWTIKCDKFDEKVPNVKGWECAGDKLGSKCLATCDGGRSPFGEAVCRRNGRFIVTGMPGSANLNKMLPSHIGCEYQCKRPPVRQGSLRGCERPRDGTKCEPTCEKGFTDVDKIECHLIGNSTVKTADGNEEFPYRWTVGDTPPLMKSVELNYDLICAPVAVRDSGDCERGKKCALGFVKENEVTQYLGPKAKVNRTAVVVTYNDVDSSKWRGELPATCPKPKDIFGKKLCYTDDSNECHAAAVLEKGKTLDSLVLGDGEIYGGCENRALSTDGDKFITVIALFELSDGTIRKMVILQEPKQLTPTQIAIIVGILVAILLSIIGCCVFCNRNKIFKRNAASDPPPPPAAVAVPLVPVQPAVQPPPPAQPYYPPAGATSYPQAPYPAQPMPAAPPQPQAPYPAAPPPYAPTYPPMAPDASGMQPVANAPPYPTDPMAAPPPAAAPLPYPPANPGPPPA